MFRRRKPNYELIDSLEQELGLTDAALEQRVFETKRNQEWKEKGGVVELDAEATRWAAIYQHKREIGAAAMYSSATCISLPTTVRVLIP